MLDVFDEQGDVNWKSVFDRLSEGKVVEIPCAKEREFVRRAAQVVKRAEKQNLAVTVLRSERAIRVEPRADGAPATESNVPQEVSESRAERQRERTQRRDALRAERGSERGRER